MHISVAFSFSEAFWEVTQRPLCLTQGCIEDNIAAVFGEDAAPSDPITRQIWNCLHGGVPAALVVRLLKLVADSATTTGLSEKGHGQGAATMKKHPMISKDVLCARSFVCESRALVASRENKRIEEL
jgi:hypothetical protein